MLVSSGEGADMNFDTAEIFAILIPIVLVLLTVAFVLWRNRNRRTVRKAGEPWIRIVRDIPDDDPNSHQR